VWLRLISTRNGKIKHCSAWQTCRSNKPAGPRVRPDTKVEKGIGTNAERWHSFGSVTHANEDRNRDHRDVGESDDPRRVSKTASAQYERRISAQVVGDRDVPGHEHEKNRA
jgi:hypothetical protein